MNGVEFGPDSLDRFFYARSVAVIGASPAAQKLGRWPLDSLLKLGFTGSVHAVNPNHTEILGFPCVPAISELPDDVDAAIIMLPAARAVDAAEECGRRNLTHLVIGASGFGETETGVALQSRLLGMAEQYGLRICGPNTDGLSNLRRDLSLSYQPFLHSTIDLLRGNVSIVSHSGAMISTICTQLLRAGVGISCTASCGNQLNVRLEDYLAWMAVDEGTSVIVLFIEAIRNAPDLERALQLCYRAGKHVVAVKIGHSSSAQRAVTSHTGSVAGSYENTLAFLRSRGVVCVESLDVLISTVGRLSTAGAPTAPQPRIVLSSISGGMAALGADMLSRLGCSLDPPSPAAATELRAESSVSLPINPYDFAGVFGYDHVSRVLDIFARDGFDTLFLAMGMLPDSVWQPMMQAVADVARTRFATTFVYSPHLLPADAQVLSAAGIIVGETLEPMLAAASLEPARWEAVAPAGARAAITAPVGVGVVDEATAKRFLCDAGIAVPAAVVAPAGADVLSMTAGLPRPLVAKGLAAGVLHKSELGLVKVGLTTDAEVLAEHARLTELARTHDPASPGVLFEEMVLDHLEAFVGLIDDEIFGPVLVVGFGGVFMELVRDTEILVPPFDAEVARRHLLGTSFGRALRGFRAVEYDVDAVVEVLLTMQHIGTTVPEVASLEINPLFVGRAGAGVVAADAKLELRARR
jgi:acyl-CoA synthetase (NDP forming)